MAAAVGLSSDQIPTVKGWGAAIVGVEVSEDDVSSSHATAPPPLLLTPPPPVSMRQSIQPKPVTSVRTTRTGQRPPAPALITATAASAATPPRSTPPPPPSRSVPLSVLTAAAAPPKRVAPYPLPPRTAPIPLSLSIPALEPASASAPSARSAAGSIPPAAASASAASRGRGRSKSPVRPPSDSYAAGHRDRSPRDKDPIEPTAKWSSIYSMICLEDGRLTHTAIFKERDAAEKSRDDYMRSAVERAVKTPHCLHDLKLRDGLWSYINHKHDAACLRGAGLDHCCCSAEIISRATVRPGLALRGHVLEMLYRALCPDASVFVVDEIVR